LAFYALTTTMALAEYSLINDFGDPVAEAKACRTDCALFDFSFLECAQVSGPKAQSSLEAFCNRRLQNLKERQIFYALRTNARGEAVADLTIWRKGPSSFEVMSGRREEIIELRKQSCANMEVFDIGASRAVFALQGPRALDTLRKLGDVSRIAGLAYFGFATMEIADISCTVGRLGYTGESGFEIITEKSRADLLWKALSAHARPAGFIAADMLRIEAGFVLFCNEFRVPVSPIEAGLRNFQRPAVPTENPIRLVSFRADADHLSVPWQPKSPLHRPAVHQITVTSACDSTVAGGVLGLGYVAAAMGFKEALSDPTGQFRNVRLTALPFYDTAKRRPRAAWI